MVLGCIHIDTSTSLGILYGLHEFA